MKQETLQDKARELLKNKGVDVIIGYKRSPDGVSAAPAFIYRQEDADTLVWDAHCVYNLSCYLKDFYGKKAGIVAKACDIKSIIVLLQEHQVKREDVLIISVECFGVIDESFVSAKEAAGQLRFARKCRCCASSLPQLYDLLITAEEEKKQLLRQEEDPYESVRKMEVKSLEERLKTWQEEFSRCIRCYACRQVCPLCYCPRCVADQIQPQWFSRADNQEGNFTWNVIRAIHLAGRCIDCGECDRACPMGIPLRQINKKIEKDVKEMFNFEAGTGADQKPLLAGFDASDPDEFIK
jgi:ferredoxin